MITQGLLGGLRARLFLAAAARLLSQPEQLRNPRTLWLLRVLWGNRLWSMAEPTLLELTERMPPGAVVLEIGTGLSTVIGAYAAKRTGARIIAVDHSAEWCETVRGLLAQLGLSGTATVLHAPVKDHGDFTWYDLASSPELRAAMREARLVLCDAPPGFAKGGRVGLVSIDPPALAAGTLIILDDYHRPLEKAAVETWRTLRPLELLHTGPQERFATLRLG